MTTGISPDVMILLALALAALIGGALLVRHAAGRQEYIMSPEEEEFYGAPGLW